jgi:hypothetical protein
MQIPDVIKEPFEQLPIGVMACRVTEAHQDMIGQQNPKWGIVVNIEVTEPEDFAGTTDTVNFMIGTDEDPGDLQNQVTSATFTARAGRFERFCNAAMLEIRGAALEVALSDLKDRSLKGRTTASKEPVTFQFGARKGQANPFAGRYRVNWTQWMRHDEGPQPNIQTTVREIEAKENDGGAGQRPLFATGPAQVGFQATAAPPPPPSPGSRAPMPRVDRPIR